jgi:ABC-type transport system involved in multi-copper enzyme maturation permease subunit
MKLLAVIQRELKEQMRNRKLLIVVLCILGGAYMALYTEAGPTSESGSVLEAFFDLFHIVSPFIGILIAMDAVVGEKEWGTLELVLTKPLSRTTLLVGKFAAYTLVMVPLIVVELILAYYWAQVSGISTLRWQLPMPPFSQWLAMITILSLLCMFYIAIAIFISLYARSTATSGLMSLIAILPGTPLGTEILKGLGWTEFGKLALPYKIFASLFEGYQVYALTSAYDFWICAFSLLLLAVVLLLVAGQRFEKQDIAFRM